LQWELIIIHRKAEIRSIWCCCFKDTKGTGLRTTEVDKCSSAWWQRRSLPLVVTRAFSRKEGLPGGGILQAALPGPVEAKG
jgi:hypothetical protein